MRNLFVLATMVFTLGMQTVDGQQYLPNYTVGIPVNDTLYVFSRSASNCAPSYDTYFGIFLNTSVTGLKYYLLVDSVDNTVNIPPYGSVQKGDTLPISASMYSYQLFISYPGFVRLMLRVTGIPQLASETYSCGNPSIMNAGMSCSDFDTFGFDQVAYVKVNNSFSGKLYYDNNYQTPITPAKVYLLSEQGVILDSSATDLNGLYHFNNPQDGNYKLTVKTSLPWGGVNANDALIALHHSVESITLTGLRFKAGDVNANYYINATDALGIAKRFVQLSSSFPIGDWVFEEPEITISDTSSHVINIKALCTGDLDASYVPFIQSFVTCGDTLTDQRDNQKYPTVQIGTQCWMKKNLNVGTMVSRTYNPDGSHSDCSNNGVVEKYCYNNDPANCLEFGGLYDWNEMMQYDTSPGIQGICPSGWHIPTDDEWCTLTTSLDTTVNCTIFSLTGVNAGGKLKETGLNHWVLPNTGATNQSGFTALGTGGNIADGSFAALTLACGFWTSSGFTTDSSVAWELGNTTAKVFRYRGLNTQGFSIRCIKGY